MARGRKKKINTMHRILEKGGALERLLDAHRSNKGKPTDMAKTLKDAFGVELKAPRSGQYTLSGTSADIDLALGKLIELAKTQPGNEKPRRLTKKELETFFSQKESPVATKSTATATATAALAFTGASKPPRPPESNNNGPQARIQSRTTDAAKTVEATDMLPKTDVKPVGTLAPFERYFMQSNPSTMKFIEKQLDVRFYLEDAELKINTQDDDRRVFASEVVTALRAHFAENKKLSRQVGREILGQVMKDNPDFVLPAKKTQPKKRKKGRAQPKSQEERNQAKIARALTNLNIVFEPHTEMQAHYYHCLQTCDITFGIGPAGTGKTASIAVAALEALKSGRVDRIILSAPAVGADENNGFRPGTIENKIASHLRPITEELIQFGGPAVQELIDLGVISVVALEDIKGLNFRNAFAIMDEAHNATLKQLWEYTTRAGHGTVVALNGNTVRIFRSGAESVLEVLYEVFPKIAAEKEIDGVRLDQIINIGQARFTNDDNVRGPLSRLAEYACEYAETILEERKLEAEAEKRLARSGAQPQQRAPGGMG